MVVRWENADTSPLKVRPSTPSARVFGRRKYDYVAARYENGHRIALVWQHVHTACHQRVKSGINGYLLSLVAEEIGATAW